MENSKIKKRHYGQVVIEFISAFIALMLLLVAITKIFVWMGSTIIGRNRAFEDSRTKAGNSATVDTTLDFYNKTSFPKKEDLKIF